MPESDVNLLLKHIETTRNTLVFEQEAEIRRLNEEIASLRLTDEEREAVEFFANTEWPKSSQQIKARAATLRALLERTK